MFVPESAQDYHIVVAAGAVMDTFGISYLEMSRMLESEIYELFQLILDEEVQVGK